jgi:predicted NBD/HSP70 family sugar kinase
MLQLDGQVLVLREVHAGRVHTRTDLGHRHGMSRGSASELATRLRDASLLDEQPGGPTGRRGRPTSVLKPHPAGPLVCAVDLGYERWSVALFALGGAIVDRRDGRHLDRAPATVLGAVAAAAGAVTAPVSGRVAAVSVAVAGVVRGTGVVQASTLGWRNVDLAVPLRDVGDPTLTAGHILVGNDATLAGLAEARRGAATDARVLLHLSIGVGIGGVLVVDGTPQTGATGAGGEFGHLPFGDQGLRCPCGATGCWDVAVDGRALARLLGQPEPADPVGFAGSVVAAAHRGDGTARATLDHVASTVGRGVGALVNALDPDMVALAGLGTDLIEVSRPAMEAGYRTALMAYRRDGAPPIIASAVPGPAALVGAAEHGFDHVLTAVGLDRWLRTRDPLATGPGRHQPVRSPETSASTA